jgi:hypothetical protein
MHKQNGRSFTVVAEMDGDVVELDALMFPIVEVRYLGVREWREPEKESADNAAELHGGGS